MTSKTLHCPPSFQNHVVRFANIYRSQAGLSLRRIRANGSICDSAISRQLNTDILLNRPGPDAYSVDGFWPNCSMLRNGNPKRGWLRRQQWRYRIRLGRICLREFLYWVRSQGTGGPHHSFCRRRRCRKSSVAVLSDAYWRTRFARVPAVIDSSRYLCTVAIEIRTAD